MKSEIFEKDGLISTVRHWKNKDIFKLEKKKDFNVYFQGTHSAHNILYEIFSDSTCPPLSQRIYHSINSAPTVPVYTSLTLSILNCLYVTALLWSSSFSAYGPLNQVVHFSIPYTSAPNPDFLRLFLLILLDQFEFSSPPGAWVRVAALVLKEETFVQLWGEVLTELSDWFNVRGTAG